MFGNNKNTITQEELDEMLSPLLDRINKLETVAKKQAQQIALLEQKLSNKPIADQVDVHGVDSSDGSFEHSDSNAIGPTQDNLATDVQNIPPTLNTFYLPAPNSNGQFLECSNSIQVGKSIYQLSTKDGINGQFIMLTTPDAIATAMISISQFVKPACRIEGNTHQQPRQIETLEEGTAQRDGDVWRVITKAKVLFQ